MKRLARLVGVMGGIAAVLWAMRERFVSIAAPREPEPPTFRVLTPPGQSLRPPAPDDLTPDDLTPDDLTQVNGIGPVFARRLMEGGLSTFAQLARADVERVVEITGVPESKATDWISQAGEKA